MDWGEKYEPERGGLVADNNTGLISLTLADAAVPIIRDREVGGSNPFAPSTTSSSSSTTVLFDSWLTEAHNLTRMRILVVEDEPRMANVIAKGLREESYAVDLVHDGDAVLYQAAINDYDVIVLDVLLPQRDGFEVCRELRKRGNATPILMLTARAAIDDRITGFDAGADDYLTKPFSFRELLARIRALLRRDSQLRPDILEIGDLIVDAASHRVSRANTDVQLTAKEYALLEYLARRAGKLVSRADIAAHVWDDTFEPFSNTIDVYINRLRKKIDGQHTNKLLQTRRGEGYILESRQ